MEPRRPRVRPAASESSSGEKKRSRPDDKLQIKKFSFVVEKLFSHELMKSADVSIFGSFRPVVS